MTDLTVLFIWVDKISVVPENFQEFEKIENFFPKIKKKNFHSTHTSNKIFRNKFSGPIPQKNTRYL